MFLIGESRYLPQPNMRGDTFHAGWSSGLKADNAFGVPLTFAVGLNLASLSGAAAVSSAVVAVTWVVMLTWCAAIVVAFVLQHRLEAGHAVSDRQRAWLRLYRRVDLWLRWLWLVAIGGALISGASAGAMLMGAQAIVITPELLEDVGKYWRPARRRSGIRPCLL